MDPVTVARYSEGGLQPVNHSTGQAEGPAWLGTVETPNWIVWENSDGELYVFNGREQSGAVTGAVVVMERQTGPYGLPGVRVHSDGSHSPIPAE